MSFPLSCVKIVSNNHFLGDFMLEIKNGKFTLNDKSFNIYSGAIHYFRVLPEYWEDRLTKLKLAGFNTVETYVCWNLHEPKKGQFNFEGMLDLVNFLKIAQKVGLYAIVRPGPYICAEWDFGGLPAWLLKDENIRIRCANEIYLNHVKDFYVELLKRLNCMQITKGGNIIAMQVENEYGSYGSDKEYLNYVKNLMLDSGIDVLLFTSDGPTDFMLSGGSLPEVFKVVNFGSGAKNSFNILKKYQDNSPKMCGEFWCGWFDHWGERHHTRAAFTIENEIKNFLDADASFNFYMFHGGTNFNFYAGANHTSVYQPTVTSYDYCALLNEWGDYTPAYHAVRDIMLKHQKIKGEALPPSPKLQNIGEVKLINASPLKENIKALAEKHYSPVIETMEHFDQNFGMIAYRTTLKGDYGISKINIDGVHDRAYVYINGNLKACLDRTKKSLFKKPSENFVLISSLKKNDVIEILVDCMGRVNYGKRILDRKGLGNVYINNQVIMGWEIFTLPLDNIDKVTFTTNVDGNKTYPAFLKGSFTAGKGDCFIDMSNFAKGVVYVNNFNLGRYWKKGPQKSLYLPGAILKEHNELVILELEGCSNPSVTISDKHKL